MSEISIAIVGATGAVGLEFIRLLENSKIKIKKLKLFASNRLPDRKLNFLKEKIPIEQLQHGCFKDIDLAFFSAGSPFSLEWSPEAIASNAIVIDNSSAFRLEPDVPLIVPEINIEEAKKHKGVISNPNCTTIIFLLGIYEIYKKYGVQRGVVSTYQAVSGAGSKGVNELLNQNALMQLKRPIIPEIFQHQIAYNLIPQIGEVVSFGNTAEENKLRNESRKILADNNLVFSTTCVRVPVIRAHSISATLELQQSFDVDAIRDLIQKTPYLKLEDRTKECIYPMPINYSGVPEVGVGRIRHAEAYENGLSLWIVGDQLLRGAAYNAFRIAEEIF